MGALKEAGIYLTTGWRRGALTAFFVLLSLLVIGRILYTNQDVLRSYEWEIRPIWALYAIIFFLIDLIIALYGWHLLVVKLANYDNLRNNVKFCLYSSLARRIPGGVWYIASRALLYQQVGVTKKTTTLLSALEMTLFLISSLLTTLLTLPFWQLPDGQMAWLQSRWIFLFFPLLLLFLHPAVIQRGWRWFARGSSQISLTVRDTLQWMVVYVLTWVVGGMVLYCVVGLFRPISPSHVIEIIGIWSLAGFISLIGFMTLSFIGLREISLALLLSPLIPLPVAIIIGITIRILWLSGELITGLLSLKL